MSSPNGGKTSSWASMLDSLLEELRMTATFARLSEALLGPERRLKMPEAGLSREGAIYRPLWTPTRCP
jgi:hypothetical protein